MTRSQEGAAKQRALLEQRVQPIVSEGECLLVARRDKQDTRPWIGAGFVGDRIR